MVGRPESPRNLWPARGSSRAVVVLLHLALAGAPRTRAFRPAAIMQAWRQPSARPVCDALAAPRQPSNPTSSYAAGRLALTCGMAVVVLSRWLHVMTISSPIGR